VKQEKKSFVMRSQIAMSRARTINLAVKCLMFYSLLLQETRGSSFIIKGRLQYHNAF